MSTGSSPDREAFQQLLANAFAVQESQMDRQLLSAIMEVQRLIVKGEIGVDGAMNLVVDGALDVANASGVAIGLLEGNQLTYRAGGGCCANCVGSHVAASLTVSADTKTIREILRVENAQTDKRIEAAICRQLGAQSILILPVYQDRTLAGVLEILFNEAHGFQDREVRTYRLMAGLVETALSYAARDGERENLQQENLQEEARFGPAIEQAPQGRDFLEDYFARSSSRTDAIYQRCGAVLAAVREWPLFKQRDFIAKMLKNAKAFTADNRRRNAALAAAAAALVLSVWIAHAGRSRPSVAAVSDRVPTIERQEDFNPEKATAALPARHRAFARTAVRRKRVGRDVIDYIGDDVTVRHFAPKASPRQSRAVATRVAYVGEDVTVRYFAPKATVKPATR